MNEQLNTFFKKHEFQKYTMASLTENIVSDRKKGLTKSSDGSSAAYQPMIPVYGLLEDKPCTETTVIVIDAGGTNFRSALVHFSKDGSTEITDVQKSSMPGIERELSREEFYNAIADKIDYLKNKASKIGFCFSYAMEMTKENDGKVLVFSKEIKAPEVVGTYVGDELLKVLKNRGWTTVEKITLLNDTVAALLSGFSEKQENGKPYDSYIGFVFGTGMNNAYIESGDIQKIDDNGKKHIVVCECGMFNGVQQSYFDQLLDKDSVDPGSSLLEKMCSGAYMGKLTYLLLKTACEENLFSAPFAEEFKTINKLVSADLDAYLRDTGDTETVLGKIASKGTSGDKEILSDIIYTVINRTAVIISSVLSASITKTLEHSGSDEQIALVCDGSTFWKCHSLADTVQKLLKENLSEPARSQFNIIKVDNDIMMGTAVAAVKS